MHASLIPVNFNALKHLLTPISDEQFEELLRREGQPGVEGSVTLADYGLTPDQVRTFAGISDPRSADRFSAESARKAFAGVPIVHETDEELFAAVREHLEKGKQRGA